ENRWRHELPQLFPAGDLSSVRGVPRLPVRARLLVVFLLTSVGPLALLGLVAWRRGRLAAADPANAGMMLGEMLAIIGFFIVAGLVAAVRLSWVVSDSVAAPLLGLTFAMARVERGDLAAYCPVVSNDETGAATEGLTRMLGGLREREAIKDAFARCATASACTRARSSPAPSAAATGSRTRSSATPSTSPPASRASPRRSAPTSS